jgi:hypothetical protein
LGYIIDKISSIFFIKREVVLMVNYCFLGNTENLSKGFDGSSTSPDKIALAFYGCFWSYGGW